jgi:hypothetical protein
MYAVTFACAHRFHSNWKYIVGEVYTTCSDDNRVAQELFPVRAIAGMVASISPVVSLPPTVRSMAPPFRIYDLPPRGAPAYTSGEQRVCLSCI